MPRLIAATVCALLIWELFRLNREAGVRTSKALWIPCTWLFFAASRNVSEWLRRGPSGSSEYTEGSPLDRAVFTAILALGVIVLFGRSRRVGKLLQSNFPILIYFLYCGISIFWSDFPDVSFKRWFRAWGDVVMVLVVLTDANWLAAFRRLFARVGFLLVPISILFIRYIPEYGRFYSRGGETTWTGVATDKNALGMLCMIFGLAAVFRFLQIYRGEESTRRTGPLFAQGTIIMMAIYLLLTAHSATALSCFFLGGVPMALTYLYGWARKPAFVHLMVFGLLGVAFSALFLNVGTGMVEDLGRNSTLTGRTAIWSGALGIAQNPLLGTGFESFWVGPRPIKLESVIHMRLNEAHNGYIEVFLNLGWLGVTLLTVLLVTAYRRIVFAVRSRAPVASLRLAFFITVIAYNFTEAGFKVMHPMWIILLLITMMISEDPFPKYLSPLGLDRADDLAERQPEDARSYIPSKLGGPPRSVFIAKFCNSADRLKHTFQKRLQIPLPAPGLSRWDGPS
jgi:exopolysaccharide production protein ExoQ